MSVAAVAGGACAGFVVGAAVVLVLARGRRSAARGGAAAPARDAAATASPRTVPRHVAFIMDGNRRYGAAAFGPARRLEGHAAGGRKLGDVVDWCVDTGVAECTVFAFSTENWRRDAAEVALLMRTFLDQADEILVRARARGVRCRVLCTDDARLPADVRARLGALEAGTARESRLLLNLAVSYGARSELARAAAACAARCARGEMSPADVDEAAVARELALRSCPDLLVRTSGERRLSNFLLWQVAYSELVFLDKHWPELARADFDAVLAEYARRQRRFGK